MIQINYTPLKRGNKIWIGIQSFRAFGFLSSKLFHAAEEAVLCHAVLSCKAYHVLLGCVISKGTVRAEAPKKKKSKESHLTAPHMPTVANRFAVAVIHLKL